MIDFEAGKDFLVAVPWSYQQDQMITVEGVAGPVTGRVVEAISHQDYLEVWAFRGFPSEGVSAMRPRFYYRCQKISDKPPLTVETGSESALRGDQESAS